MNRDETISICKAFGILLMVIGHSSCPVVLCSFIYEFHMPLFFITAGYFFSLKYLNDEATFVKKRIKGLYIPFVKWSVFFLVIHNLMFTAGILNEKYGNINGGVTHPYSWHQIQQNLWNIVTAMGGYDQFLNGAFWFFRGLFVTSIVYLILFKLLDNIATRYGKDYKHIVIPSAICVIALFTGIWKSLEGLKVINLIQGGSREIMGVFFFSCGLLFRQLHHRYAVTWWNTLLFCITVYLFSRFALASMTLNMSLGYVISLPVPAVCGFLMTYNISSRIAKRPGWLRNFLVFCGNNTMCILVFHIICYKPVSLLKIWYYGLDIKQIGCHLVIHDYATTDYFWILYSIAGAGIPLAWTWAYRRIAQHIRAGISKTSV